MIDTIIKGTGNSRSIRSVPNLAALAPTYDKLLELLTSQDGLPVDVGPLNLAGLLQEGTNLNKTALLTDETAALYEKGSDATPNDIFAAIQPQVSLAFATANQKCRFQTGFRSGAGTTGAFTISFSFNPSIVFYSASANSNDTCASGAFIRSMSKAYVFSTSGGTGVSLSWGTNSLTITPSSGTKLNGSGVSYYYAAFV